MVFGGIFDDITGKSARKARRANEASHNRGLGIFDRLENRTANLFGMGQQYASQMLPTIGAGFDRALREVDRTQDAAYQRSQDMLGQRIGASTQALTSRGLSNTTLLGNQIDQAYGQTQREMQEIDSLLAGLRSDVRLSQVGAEVGALNALMNYYQRQTSLEQGTAGIGLDANYGVQYSAPTAGQSIAGILQGIGSLIPG